MDTTPAGVSGLRGVWMSVADFSRSRVFYEHVGARFDAVEPMDGIVSATLGGTRLVFEIG